MTTIARAVRSHDASLFGREPRQHPARRKAPAAADPAAQRPAASPDQTPGIREVRDGDLVRWMNGVALVHIPADAAETVFVRALPIETGLFGYSNRLLKWDALPTPIYTLTGNEHVELLLRGAAALKPEQSADHLE